MTKDAEESALKSSLYTSFMAHFDDIMNFHYEHYASV